MNYLAHLYLSGKDNDIKIGNFIADHVKGKNVYNFGEGIQCGIRLHRFIDEYTDNHRLVHQGIERIKPHQGRYSGVVIDMYYDHFLASNWKDYSGIPLTDFTTETYLLLLRNFFKLPVRTKILLPFIMKRDWLASYGDLNFLDRAFHGLSRRTPYNSQLSMAVDDLTRHYYDFKSEFEKFFPEIIQSVHEKKKELHTSGLCR